MPIEALTGLDSTLLAYLDPGLGSLQFQILVAGLLSAGFFVKAHLIQARQMIGRVWRRGN